MRLVDVDRAQNLEGNDRVDGSKREVVEQVREAVAPGVFLDLLPNPRDSIHYGILFRAMRRHCATSTIRLCFQGLVSVLSAAAPRELLTR